MSKLLTGAKKSKRSGARAFVAFRQQLGAREVVAPAMGTNRVTLYRWEHGINPVPQWALILVGLLVEKYPGGIADTRGTSAEAGPETVAPARAARR